MKLRNWQTARIAGALEKYQSKDKHFLCLATRGWQNHHGIYFGRSHDARRYD